MNRMYGRMKIVYDDSILENSTHRLFPESKNRSKRILKKLIKRYGGEYREVPCIYLIDGVIYAHPAMKAEIENGLIREV